MGCGAKNIRDKWSHNSLRKSDVPNLHANVNAFSNLKEKSHLEFRDSLFPVASGGAVSPTWLT